MKSGRKGLPMLKPTGPSSLTGPRNVTVPLAVIIFTFFAMAESESSLTTARRMAAVVFTSSLLLD